MIYHALGHRVATLDAADRIGRISICFMPYLREVRHPLSDEPCFVWVVERVGLPRPD